MPNLAPAGADRTVSIPRNYALRLANFGFGDSDGNGLLGVRFTTLPTAGTLYFDANGALGGGAGRVAVTAGQTISAADIAAGRVTFVAEPTAVGANYASLTFQVQDNGGTADGGIDLDQSANTLTFDIAAGTPFGSTIDLTGLSASTGFTIRGAATQDFAGHHVSSAGDVNGDGIDDLIVGAWSNDSGGVDAGAAYVIYGRTTGFSSLINLASLSASDGFRIQGAAAGDLAGWSASGAGDVNGDGIADIIVGARNNGAGGGAAGAAYVIFGRSTGFGSLVNLNSLSSADGFTVQGDVANDEAGFSVAAAGDVNGDGFADIIIGARRNGAGGLNAGAAYVIFGKASGFGSLIDLTDLSATDGFKIQGDTTGDYTGARVSSAGDVNGDGFADIFVSARGNSAAGSNAGAAYVIFGKASGFGNLLDLRQRTAADGFKILGDFANDYAGIGLSSAGDINGDGFADIIVGASGNDSGGSRAGAAYVIFGKASGFGPLIDLTGLSATVGFKIQGGAADDYAGVSVSSAGDVNGDGFADLLVGAWGNDAGGSNAGSAYLIFGRASGFASLIDLSKLSASVGVRIQGDAAGDNAGYSVSSAGDINGDGFADIIVGARRNGLGGTNAGAAYVIFGHAMGRNTAPSGTDVTLTINEDTPRTLTAADFGFVDADGHVLASVTITSLPTAGILRLNGNAVTAGDIIPVASLPQLVFTPDANANGDGNASFTFQVRDDGGTADGGVDLDPTANSVTFNVTPVNDAPTLTGVPTNIGTFSAGVAGNIDLSATTIADIDSSTLTVTLTANAGSIFSATAVDGITVGGTANVLTISGTVTALNAYLDVASNVRWTPSETVSGNTTISVNVSDGALAAAANTIATVAFTPLSITTAGTALTQDFDALARTGLASLTIRGWAQSETGTSANSSYTAGTGASATGDMYSFGATGSTDRAFGGIQTAALVPVFGAAFTNNTGAFINSLLISYTGEQWRFGQLNRNAADRLDFQISTDATSLTTGTWLDINQLDFIAPIITGAAGARDGNLAANQSALSFDITTLSIAAGATFWIRWTDFNVSGSDDGLAVDNFSLTGRFINHAPGGTDATLTIAEDTPRTLTAADFGFSDTDGNSLAAVRITTLPTAGTLTLDGNAVTAGDRIPVASLSQLVFTPALNANGTGYASFTFQVQDNGGTADGGVDLDASANTLTLDVSAVDDVPVAVADPANSVDENATLAISVLANDTDVDGGPITVAMINGTAATVGAAITLASGATATLNADGTISYDPNGRFNHLVSAATAAATGALNGSATDSFTYALNGGSSTTVTVAINGVDGAGSELRGDSGADTVTGTSGNDLFNLGQGGDDTASGGTGNDGFYFGATFDGNDNVDGGAGTLDQVALQGNYSAGVTLSATSAVGIEQFVLLPGSDTRFGVTGNPTLGYNIITGNAAIATGQQMIFQANRLRVGESFMLDASGELDGSVFTYGGLGTETLRGSQNADSFFFGTGRFNAGDVVDGQGGVDQLGLQGTYSGANAVTFGAGQLLNLEMIVCLSNNDSRFGGAGSGTPYSYTLTMNDGNVAAGATLIIQANALASDEVLTFNGAAELDGHYTIYSGNGADSIIGGALADIISGRGGADNLTGGGGNDVFLYTNLTDSITTAQDHILDFASGDTIDLSRIDAITGGANNAFSYIGDAAFGNIAGQLRAVNTAGSDWLVEADVNGDGIADLSILVTTSDAHVLGAGDFVL